MDSYTDRLFEYDTCLNADGDTTYGYNVKRTIAVSNSTPMLMRELCEVRFMRNKWECCCFFCVMWIVLTVDNWPLDNVDSAAREYLAVMMGLLIDI